MVLSLYDVYHWAAPPPSPKYAFKDTWVSGVLQWVPAVQLDNFEFDPWALPGNRREPIPQVIL